MLCVCVSVCICIYSVYIHIYVYICACVYISLSKKINQAIQCLLKIYNVKRITGRARPHGGYEDGEGRIHAFEFKILMEERLIYAKIKEKPQG